jgi:1-acyl-sn-glycerol-3-phosphate acyltransferase
MQICGIISGASWLVLFALYQGVQILLSPLWFFHKSKAHYQLIDGWLFSHLTGILVYCVESAFRTSLVLSGNLDGLSTTSTASNVILMSNHVAYSDWLTMLMIASRAQTTSYLRWIVKGSLRFIPFIRLRDFIALPNRSSKDLDIIYKGIQHLDAVKPRWWVIFPEGTFVDGTLASNAVVSKGYAYYKELLSKGEMMPWSADEKSDPLAPFSFVLCPRWKGLVTALKALRESSQVDAILVDCTMAFSGNGFKTALPLDAKDRKIPSLLSVIFGKGPKEVHVHVKSYKISDIPRSDEDFVKWLYRVWQKKEVMLGNFDKDGFPGPIGAIGGIDKTRFASVKKYWPTYAAIMTLFPLFVLAFGTRVYF